MKYVFTVLAIVATLITFGYIQDDHLECECIAVTDDSVTFEAYGDNAYIWYEDNASDKYTEGNIYKVTFFDFEDFDVTNNAIVKVGKEVR